MYFKGRRRRMENKGNNQIFAEGHYFYQIFSRRLQEVHVYREKMELICKCIVFRNWKKNHIWRFVPLNFKTEIPGSISTGSEKLMPLVVSFSKLCLLYLIQFNVSTL